MAPSFDGRSNWALLVAGGLATHISSFSPFMKLRMKQFWATKFYNPRNSSKRQETGQEREFWWVEGVDTACGDPRQGRAVSLVSQHHCWVQSVAAVVVVGGKALGSSCHTRQELQEGRSTHWTQCKLRRLWQLWTAGVPIRQRLIVNSCKIQGPAETSRRTKKSLWPSHWVLWQQQRQNTFHSQHNKSIDEWKTTTKKQACHSSERTCETEKQMVRD